VHLRSRHFRQRAQDKGILEDLRARQLDPFHRSAELAMGEDVDIQLAGAEAAGVGGAAVCVLDRAQLAV